jgi:thioredoxin reductase (NADPH)
VIAAHRRLQLYYRHGCHLCEDMLRELLPLREELGIEVEVVDVDADRELQARYDALVPVLADRGRELCRYFLDPAAVRRWAAAG